MSEIKYYSEEGLQKLKDELHHLIAVERPAASAAIAEARDKGDLSENAEYDAAKEAQGHLEARISKLQDLIANARLLASREGIFAGSSSGGALAAALKLAETGARGNIVVVFPDRGDRYYSKGLYEAPAE